MSQATTPSASLLTNLRSELMHHAPFAQMAPEHVERFIAQSQQAYYAPDETVFAPEMGPVQHLVLVRTGRVTGHRGLAEKAGGFEYESGDLFPVGAVMGGRAVTSHYRATEDCFCLLLPVAAAQALAAQSAAFADFLNRKVMQFLDLSRKAVQAVYASRTLAEQSLETPLGLLTRKTPATVSPDTALSSALAVMHERRIGSILVVDASGAIQGILTRHDILGRVTLPQVSLDSSISNVMTRPVLTLTTAHTAQDAALLMSRHGVQHVPVTEDGRVVNIVSERDLFAIQRLSLKQVSTSIRAARDLLALQLASEHIRRFARNLLGQGVRARQLTELISHLNDVLTDQLVALVARRRGLDLQRACWVAFGSEGRSEQTIATDQDNGLVFASDDPARDRPAWLEFAREVNDGLDACGYPLCKGNVMASNPQCCLSTGEWTARFAKWLEHGAPEDLLKASIYFDVRALAGNSLLSVPLREFITTQAPRLPRFIKQLADNALTHRSPLNWRGGIDTREQDGRAVVDLKLQGTAIFVDVARLYALARGVAATGTRERLEAVGRALNIEPQESEAWIGAFEFLQMLRLQVQLELDSRHAVADPQGNQNLIDVAALNDIDRRMLKESFRIARQLQQRMALDYQR